MTAPAQPPPSPVTLGGPSIGLKIFGISASLLGLIVGVVYVCTDRLRQVNTEVTSLAHYVIPITDRVAQVDGHALQQELHFERVQTLYALANRDALAPTDESRIQQEILAFTQLGTVVDREIAQAIAQAEAAHATAPTAQVQAKWAAVVPQLITIEQQHQQFQDQAEALLAAVAAGDDATVRQLQAQILTTETNFNAAINAILLDLAAFTVSSAQAGQAHQQLVQTLSVLVAAGATVFGLGYAAVVTVGLVRPVQTLDRDLGAVRAGDLDTQFTVASRDEVGTLAGAFNHMVAELRGKAQLEATFGQYVDPRIVPTLMAEEANQGQRQVMTVGFARGVGLEAVLATLPPDIQVQGINRYLSLISASIADHDGVIDKFMGTTVMGFWGPPFVPSTDHALRACQAALAQVAAGKAVGPAIAAAIPTAPTMPSVPVHLGLATGPLVVGTMGSTTAKAYTVMGDTVNIASRLQGASTQYGVAILISADTQRQVAATLATREIDLIQVVGKADPVRIYELMGPLADQPPAQAATLATFAAGLAAYRAQDWTTARQHFAAVLAAWPTDGPTQVFLHRIDQFSAQPPSPDWDGVWQLTQK